MAFSADLGWKDDTRAEQHVEDEFTCSDVLRDSLLAQQRVVARLFGVMLRIGEGEASCTPQDGQIWLQLKGRKREVEAAKIFVKGIVNQEAQKEVQYPETLHCVFCGAKGLFIESLIKNTSAHIVVGSMGFLLISGMTEPVVKAYSLITDLIDKYNDSQVQPCKTACESLESRRAFKSLVERLEDRHVLDLLVLPVLVKELLLDLVKQSALDSEPLDNISVSAERETLFEISKNVDRLILGESNKTTKGSAILLKSNGPSLNHPTESPGLEYKNSSYGISYPGMANTEKQTRGGGKTAELPRHLFGKFISDLEHAPPPEAVEEEKRKSNTQNQFGGASLDPNKEEESQQREHLLKFFTAMGYKEEVVGRVLARSGAQEPSQILDLVQQEQDPTVENGAAVTKEDDFVQVVTKKAAASCGYTEEKVDEVYSNLPKIKPHQLILELQKEGVREPEVGRLSETRSAEDLEEHQMNVPIPQRQKEADLMKEKRNERVDKEREANMEKAEDDEGVSLREKSKKKDKEARGRGKTDFEPKIPGHFMEQDRANKKPDLSLPSQNEAPSNTIAAPVRGPPQPMYSALLNHKHSDRQVNPAEPPVTKAKQKKGFPPVKTGAVVTGAQRYLEGLDTPFVLQLNDDPGDPELRQIIIDGSNVALSHGLGIFFSCRGIALAVQFFWSRGHRKITVFVPQWRQKRDPKIKEQHFMTELQDLGLLSFTPSREVMKQRIHCHDVRFMLQLAQQTDGVIVTNDNMRDLVDESVTWREIIKKRLLQYVFVEDFFMVPNDPLGRGGPHIDDFLRLHSRSPVRGSPSFAGVASSSPPFYQPRAQTMVLQYREQTPGGVHTAHGSSMGQSQAGRKTERTSEDTLRLKQELVQIFPGQESMVTKTLQCYPFVTDINTLSDFILESQGDREK